MNPKFVVLVLLAVVSFAEGAVGQLLYPGRIYTHSDLVFSVVEVALIFVWYLFDSNQRGYRRTVWLNFGVVALALVALPYYFFRSRGVRGGFIALGISIACAFALAILTRAGQYASYYGLQS